MTDPRDLELRKMDGSFCAIFPAIDLKNKGVSVSFTGAPVLLFERQNTSLEKRLAT